MKFQEPMNDVFSSSKLLVLNFAEIPSNTPEDEDISQFFKKCESQGINPRLPENRQKFNNLLLDKSGKKYLVSRYGEDRSSMLAGSDIAEEGRHIHMGIDIFTKDLEPVLAPCDGRIIRAGYEEQAHGYGHYLIIQPDDADFYIFYGHLSKDLPQLGRVTTGQKIGRLGGYEDEENGGWSRHLHLQLAKELPAEGKTPDGYSTDKDFLEKSKLWPNPMPIFPDWHLK